MTASRAGKRIPFAPLKLMVGMKVEEKRREERRHTRKGFDNIRYLISLLLFSNFFVFHTCSHVAHEIF